MTTLSVAQMMKDHGGDGTVTAVTPGSYTLKVVRCPIAKKDGAEAGVLPIYEVVGGPDAGKTVMAGSMYLTEAAAGIFFRNLRGFGITPEFVEQGATLKDIADALVGRTVEIELSIKNWKGEDRNEFKPGAVKLISAPDGSPNGIPQAAAPVPTPAAVAAPPAPVAPPVPVAAPAAAAPAAVAAPDPAAAPAPTPAAATVPPPPPASTDKPPF